MMLMFFVMGDLLAQCPQKTSELSAPFLDTADPRLTAAGPLIVVRKAARQIMLFVGGTREEDACWPIALGQDSSGAVPLGPKRREGDVRTPEGWYRTSDKPWSSFYHAIYVHYPNAEDAAAGVALGLIDAPQQARILDALARDETPPQNSPMGGEILIHGGGVQSDWTLGCVAMNDAEIDLLRARLPANKRVDLLILP